MKKDKLSALEVKEELLQLGVLPTVINGHRVERFYADIWSVDGEPRALHLSNGVSLEKAIELITATKGSY